MVPSPEGGPQAASATVSTRAIDEAARMYERAFDLDFLTPHPSDETYQRRRDEHLARLYSNGYRALQTALASRPLAEMWLPEEAVAVLDQFAKGLKEADAEPSHEPMSRVEMELETIRAAYRGLLEVARADMRVSSDVPSTGVNSVSGT